MNSENHSDATFEKEEIIRVGETDVHIRGEGETIVLIHGWPDSLHLWDAQVEALSKSYRCARFTLPGFDRRHTRRMYVLEDLIQTIRDVVDAIGRGAPVTLMLHDWGCIWGYQYYLRHPKSVRRIIGVDVGDAGSPELLAELSMGSKLFIAAYQLWLALAWKLGGGIGDAMTRWMARKAGAPSTSERIFSGMNYAYAFVWGHRLLGRKTGLLPVRIDCPFLFIYGRRKAFRFHSRPWAQKVAAHPGSGIESLDAGHWLMAEQPETFNALVLDWLAAPGLDGRDQGLDAME